MFRLSSKQHTGHTHSKEKPGRFYLQSLIPGDSDSSGPGGGLRICISDEFPSTLEEGGPLVEMSALARVQPPQDPGKPEGGTVSAIDLEREGKNVIDKKVEERKRLIFLGLHRKPIKLQDKKFALFTEATGALRSPKGVKTQNVFPFRS